MTRDWHATYLADPATMTAARQRAATTGDDGWAAAAVLAQSFPPGFGSHDAAGARAVLAPQTEPPLSPSKRVGWFDDIPLESPAFRPQYASLAAFETDWMLQQPGRCFRLGDSRPVQVYVVSNPDSAVRDAMDTYRRCAKLHMEMVEAVFDWQPLIDPVEPPPDGVPHASG